MIATLLLTVNSFADPSREKNNRTIAFELRDPRGSFEANTSAWHAMNQSIAIGVDAVSSHGLNDKLLSRAGLFVGGLWTNSALRFYSHEAAHEYVYRAHNVSINNSLDFQHWKSSYVPGLYYPSWNQTQIDPHLLNEEELISATIAGLNQDELNADAVWHSSFSRKTISFYDAQSYLLTKFRDVEYIFKSGSNEAPFAPGQQMHQLQYDVYAETPHLFDDVNLYRLALLNNGVTISNQQLMNRALFADLMSWHTWENVWSMAAYLFNGKNSLQPFSFQCGEHVKVAPPLFSHFLTTKGSFFNSTYLFEIHNKKLLLDIGSTVGFTSIDAFQAYRVGVKALDRNVTRFWSIQPYFYLNGQSGFRINGHSLGFENFISFSENFALTIRLEHNQNDHLENFVKQERNGFQSVFGMRIML
jgi:hypothetical protein